MYGIKYNGPRTGWTESGGNDFPSEPNAEPFRFHWLVRALCSQSFAENPVLTVFGRCY
jgi:hypothetical protein